MKKIIKSLFLLSIVLVSYIVIYEVITYKTPLEKISKEVNMDLTQGEVLCFKKSDAWLDGEHYMEIGFPIAYMNELLKQQDWEMVSDNQDLQNVYTYSVDLPTVQDGYYCFVEKSEQKTILLMYDNNEELLYYYKSF